MKEPAAVGATGPSAVRDTSAVAWYDIVHTTLKRNEIRLVTYVPDRVLTPLVKAVHADHYFTTFPSTHEDEAIGIVAGAWMGGMKGAVMMQTSGFALAPERARFAAPCRSRFRRS